MHFVSRGKKREKRHLEKEEFTGQNTSHFAFFDSGGVLWNAKSAFRPHEYLPKRLFTFRRKTGGLEGKTRKRARRLARGRGTVARLEARCGVFSKSEGAGVVDGETVGEGDSHTTLGGSDSGASRRKARTSERRNRVK